MLRVGEPRPDFATLSAMFAHAVSTAPDTVALRHGDASLTYREEGRAVSALAHRLAAVAAPGEAVALLLPNSIEFRVAFFAALEALAAPALLSPLYPGPQLEPLLRDAAPRAAQALAEAELRPGALERAQDALVPAQRGREVRVELVVAGQQAAAALHRGMREAAAGAVRLLLQDRDEVGARGRQHQLALVARWQEPARCESLLGTFGRAQARRWGRTVLAWWLWSWLRRGGLHPHVMSAHGAISSCHAEVPWHLSSRVPPQPRQGRDP